MSLVGFKGQNHPQQVGKRGAKDKVDDRATSPEVFEPLMERFGFTLDVAAAAHNTKCPRWYGVEANGLEQSWAGERVWCNPPYSDIRSWVEKAWAEWKPHLGSPDPTLRRFDGSPYPQPDRPELIVMLLPANRTEQAWWQDLVEPHRHGGPYGVRVEFLRGRLRFIQAGKTSIEPNERPPFGCCLLIWGAAMDKKP